jgi:Cu2+-containing amine oxidase
MGLLICIYVKPLGGITLVVDMNEIKIVKCFNKFIVPVPKSTGIKYRASKQKPLFGPHLHGAAFVQPDRPGFKIDDNVVRLVNFFHIFFLKVYFEQIHSVPFLLVCYNAPLVLLLGLAIWHVRWVNQI